MNTTEEISDLSRRMSLLKEARDRCAINQRFDMAATWRGHYEALHEKQMALVCEAFPRIPRD